MTRQSKNITYIDDLPELKDERNFMDIDTSFDQPESSAYTDDQYKKYIRNNITLSPESGMVLRENVHRGPPSQKLSPKQEDDMMMYASQHFYGAPTCIDVANHVRMCPICSKLYNTDYTMYVLCIIILSIVCIILMKKSLNL